MQHAPAGVRARRCYSVVLVISAALLAHALPGFANPRVLDAVQLSADSRPYTKYLNFDKGAMGLLLLGLVAPQRTARRSRMPIPALLSRFALVAAVVMMATLVAGFVRWDPKLPSWWALWTWSMVFLTALPEEAVFRHVIQGGLRDWLGGTSGGQWVAMVVGGLAFGLAHLAGGWTYVALATLAGLGYGWILRRQRVDRGEHPRAHGAEPDPPAVLQLPGAGEGIAAGIRYPVSVSAHGTTTMISAEAPPGPMLFCPRTRTK